MRIFFTKRAEENYGSIIEYIKENFGETVTSAFKQKTSNFLELLSDFPEIGVVEVKHKKIRSFQLTKQTRVFYRIKKDNIVILTFFNTRQHPEKKLK